MLNARTVADKLILLARDKGQDISNLKLQKLVYYAQAWNLAHYGRPLFPERLEAWVHGPAQPALYGEFKVYGWSPILHVPAHPSLSGLEECHISEVFRAYGDLTATELERLTHKEKPWIIARRGLPVDAPSRNEISHESMEQFYKSISQ